VVKGDHVVDRHSLAQETCGEKEQEGKSSKSVQKEKNGRRWGKNLNGTPTARNRYDAPE